MPKPFTGPGLKEHPRRRFWGSGALGESHLSLQGAQDEDEGVYACRLGREEARANVTVLGRKPSIALSDLLLTFPI